MAYQDVSPLSKLPKNKAEESPESPEELREREIMAAADGLSARIIQSWHTNKRAKNKIEHRLIQCLRARTGRYTAEELSEIRAGGGSSEIYVQATGIKCRSAGAWIRDILLPDGEMAFGLKPTPLPDLPEKVERMIRLKASGQAQQMMVEQGQDLSEEQIVEMIRDLREAVQKQTKEAADEAAHKMERRIRDTMVEGGYIEAMEEFIEDFCTFPAAILKGPYVQHIPSLKWVNGRPHVVIKTALGWRRVSPFDAYPAPQSKDCQTGDFIERINIPMAELSRYKGKPGYSSEAIDKVLDEERTQRLWSWVDTERRLAEFAEAYDIKPEHSVEGLHFWGSVKGQDLIDWGTDEDVDPLEYYEIEAVLIGGHVIRAVVNPDPLKKRPYWKASYDPVPGGFWGNAIYELMFDNQQMINGSARALENNLAIAAGPQIDVNVDRVPEGTDITEIYPLKVWQTRASMLPGDNGPAISFYQPSSNATELITVMAQFEARADDATGIPRYTYGNEKVSGAGATASGLSMLMNATAKGIRRAIGHVDHGVVKNTVRMTYNHLMLYDPDPNIKGDVEIITKGTAALLVKEHAQQARREFLQATNNPTDLQLTGMEGRANVLREVAKALDMPEERVLMGSTGKVPPEIQQMQQELQQAREELDKAQQDLLKKERELTKREKGLSEIEIKTKAETEMNRVAKAEHKVHVIESQLDERELRLKALEHESRVQKDGAANERRAAETERRLSEYMRRMSQTEQANTLARLRAMNESASAQLRELLHKAKTVQQELRARKESGGDAQQMESVHNQDQQTASGLENELESVLSRMTEVQDMFARSVKQLMEGGFEGPERGQD